ncbi:hypothetical protein GCM10027296_28210 [Chitinimonas naiadis]
MTSHAAAPVDWMELVEPVFSHAAPSELPSPSVMTMAQDGQGFLWVGTQGGLARYDGYRFKSFSPRPGDPTGLPDGNISKLMVDSRGQLWLGMQTSGLVRYQAATETFRTWGADETGRHGPYSAAINTLLEADNGQLWLGGNAGLERFNPLNGRSEAFPLEPGDAPPPEVFALLRDRAGMLWVGTSRGLFRQRGHGGGFDPVSLGAVAAGPSGSHVLSLYEDSDEQLWLGMTNAVLVLDRSNKVLARFQSEKGKLNSLAPGPQQTLIEVAPGIIWAGSRQAGLSRIDLAHRRVLRFSPNPDGSSPLASTVTGLLRDRSGLIWVSGFNGELAWHNPQSHGLHTLTLAQRNLGVQDGNALAVTSLSDGQLQVGLKDGNLLSLAAGPGAPRISQRSPNGSTIFDLSPASDGGVWIGTRDGLCKEDKHRNRLQCPALPGVLERQSVRRVAESASTLWLGTPEGLVAHDKKTGQNRLYQQGNGPDSLVHKLVLSLLLDSHERLWVGTRAGLDRIDPTSKEIRHFRHDPANTDSLGPGSVVTLLEDRQGRIWAGATGGSLNVMSERADGSMAIRRIDQRDGLPHSNVCGLAEDPAGQVWASTPKGVALINPVSFKTRGMGRADGIAIQDCWAGSVAQATDGTIIFGGGGGLSIVSPGATASWDYAPPLVISSLSVNHQSIPVGQLAHGDIELPAAGRDLSVEFAALDFSGPETLRYAYRLVGYDDDWIETDATHRVATYTNLAPGSYKLELRSTNRAGDWTSQRLTFAISAQPAWYETLWFRALLISLGLLAILVAMQLRTAILRRRQRATEAIVAQRTRELSESAAVLAQLSAIGQEITASLDPQAVFNILEQHIGQMLDVRVLTIYRIEPEDGRLHRIYGKDGTEALLKPEYIDLDDPHANSARAVRERREILIERRQGEISASHIPGTRPMYTLLFAPLAVGERILGVMSIQTTSINAYGEQECLIFRSLCAFGAVALDNASAYHDLDQTLVKLKETQAKLLQQEKLASLGQLVAGIAHEINTPLGVAVAAASQLDGETRRMSTLAADGRLKRSELADFLTLSHELSGLLLNSSQRASGLIRSFKQVSADQASDALRDIDLPQYVGEVLRTLEPMLRRSGVSVRVEGIDTLLMQSYPGPIAQVLTNLLQNALLHAFEGVNDPSLTITVAAASPELAMLIVSDNGNGMPADVRNKVFEPFFTTKRNQGGTGLGMHIIHNLVTGPLGGEISLDSQPGQGTTVRITLARQPVLQNPQLVSAPPP